MTFRVGQQIRIKVERADKMTGEIDFSYIPSEWDVVEKGLKPKGVNEMVIAGIADAKTKKFLRVQR